MYVDVRTMTKRLLFAKATKKYFWDPLLKIADIVVSIEQTLKGTRNKHQLAELVQKQTSSPLFNLKKLFGGIYSNRCRYRFCQEIK